MRKLTDKVSILCQMILESAAFRTCQKKGFTMVMQPVVFVVPVLLCFILPHVALAQDDDPVPDIRDCTTQDFVMTVSFGTTAGGEMHGDGGVGFDPSNIINAVGQLFNDAADALCKVFPCGGTGGAGGGEDDPPLEDDPPPEEDPPAEGGSSADDKSQSICTTGGFTPSKILDSFTVTRKRYRNGAFHIRLASGTAGHLRSVTVGKPFSLPSPVKRAAGLAGDWYVKAGKYSVQQNQLQIPIAKR